jgi:hypothetical protein
MTKSWRKMQNEELAIHPLQQILLERSRRKRMRWPGHVACMEEIIESENLKREETTWEI